MLSFREFVALNKFDAAWLENLGVPPEQVEKILIQLHERWGKFLNDAPEEDVVAFVRSLM